MSASPFIAHECLFDVLCIYIYLFEYAAFGLHASQDIRDCNILIEKGSCLFGRFMRKSESNARLPQIRTALIVFFRAGLPFAILRVGRRFEIIRQKLFYNRCFMIAQRAIRADCFGAGTRRHCGGGAAYARSESENIAAQRRRISPARAKKPKPQGGAY